MVLKSTKSLFLRWLTHRPSRKVLYVVYSGSGSLFRNIYLIDLKGRGIKRAGMGWEEGKIFQLLTDSPNGHNETGAWRSTWSSTMHARAQVSELSLAALPGTLAGSCFRSESASRWTANLMWDADTAGSCLAHCTGAGFSLTFVSADLIHKLSDTNIHTQTHIYMCICICICI